MNRARKTAISPTRDEDYTEWYQQVIRAADLAETSAVRGCMVIKPWGYSLWENIQRVLDGMFKATGHQNAYFPLFIPLSFMQKEAEHVEGFAKECAVVTHHRLEAGPDGRLVPSGELTEPLVVRPTSETIIGATFAKWVQSYRDLPLLINQWANVVRWEMRPRIFLRTAEFLWQEGHTVHATAEDAQQETARMLGVYADFAERYMAIPVIKGEKTLSERFPGAVSTYSIEAMMQDRKALQAGTSHFLGQNFARSSEIRFSDPSGQEAYAWTTSWGVSTRLIGGLIMTHSDDNGLILPPKLAPRHVVILPLLRKDTNRAEILAYCESLAQELRALRYKGNPPDYLREDETRIPFDDDQPLQVELDVRDASGGEKVWSWIKKGVPIRLEIGQRELEGNTVFVGRRDRQQSERVSQSRAEFVATVSAQLDDIQHGLFDRARRFRDQHTQRIDSKADLYDFFTPQKRDKPEIHAGFALSHWNGQPDVEETIKNDLNVTIRCIPIDAPEEDGSCVLSGQASTRRVVFAKSY